MKRALLLVTAVAGLALFWAPSAQAFNCGTTLDSFTRANSTNLGPSWTEQAPDPAILGQTFTVAAAQTGLATFNGVQSNDACVDVQPGAGLSYAAIVLKYADLSPNNVFIKIQGAGTFNQAWFYKGNNGIAWNLGTNPHALVAFSSARFHVSVNGTTVTADIDTNFDNLPEQTVVEQNLPTTGLGNGIGLGAYGGARLDNFAIPKTQVPAGAQFSCKGKTATLVGSDAAEILNGTAAADVIVGRGGGDILRGKGGNDLICGGNGKDKLVGGKGRDSLYGNAGKDKLIGGPKTDVCIGGPGKDTARSC
jgi:Ca2+-binding RTX toxin-like protein